MTDKHVDILMELIGKLRDKLEDDARYTREELSSIRELLSTELAKYNEELHIHMKRSDALEGILESLNNRVSPIEKKFLQDTIEAQYRKRLLWFVVKLVSGLGGAGGIIALATFLLEKL